MKGMLAGFQSLGRALMLPIAVLPVAGLLLRLGQPDLLNVASVAAAGDAIFSNLGLLFAIGVAVGLARENHGAAGLAAVVGFLVATKGAEVLLPVPPDAVAGLAGAGRDLAAAAFKSRELAKLSVPVGILSGLIAGVTYNRYSDIELPSYLAFFGGRRFVPIATGAIGLVLAAAFGFGWPYLELGMDRLSHVVLESGSLGLFAYGLLNRILIVTGLHHILNNIAWFLLGDYHGVTGDLKRFFAGDPAAGAFMSGFFPVMMFGLPGACLAMYRAAAPGRRRAAGGLLLSMALTSFLTGVTEPIEFTFIFLAPALFAAHAVLTGLAMVLMQALHVRLGFSFSAGLFDYVLNFSRATRPLGLVPVGVAYFAIYYLLFYACIVRFNLKTPGRDAEASGPAPVAAAAVGEQALAFVAALGGAANLQSVDACTTRLRLVVADTAAIDRAALARLGARGVIEPGPGLVQVVLGPVADQVAGRIRAALQGRAATAAGRTTAPEPLPAAAVLAPARADAFVAALGGAANVAAIELGGDRLLVRLRRIEAIDEAQLLALGARGVARPAGGAAQLLMGQAAAEVYAGVKERLGQPGGAA
jgi:PTS system N-acetylglucosamine-specific IIC component